MSFPITITFDRTETGRFRASSPDFPAGIEAEELDEILEAVRSSLLDSSRLDEQADGIQFEKDLDYTLSKNAELYRRLAQ